MKVDICKTKVETKGWFEKEGKTNIPFFYMLFNNPGNIFFCR